MSDGTGSGFDGGARDAGGPPGTPDPRVRTDAPGTDDPVGIARAEAHRTFEYQVQRLREIDGKAIELLKANLLLVGLVVTAGSILVQTDVDLSPFVNALTVTGGALLFLSTALAGVTYTSSNLRGGMDAEAVEAAVAADEPDDYERRLLRSYGRWIEYNARVTAVNDVLATVTVLLILVSFVYVIAGVAVGALRPGLLARAALFVGLTAVLGWAMRLVYNMDHLGPRDPRWEGTFDGVRLSKGAPREEALGGLTAMAGRQPEDEE